MSIVVSFPPSNVTRQQYDTVRNALTEAGDWPADGCQLHVLFGDENDMRVRCSYMMFRRSYSI